METKPIELPLKTQIYEDIGDLNKTPKDFGYDFSYFLKDAENKIDTADKVVYDYSMGKDIPVHQVMISLEQARMSVQLLGEVRNKILDCYGELTRSV
ncbi:MAG: flagellar hook-basal body complex protein FliE [Elusimicrobiota bacterium]